MRRLPVYVLFLFLILCHGSFIIQTQANDEPQSPNVIATAWSPDGSMIAGGYADGMVSIWDTKSGETIDSFAAHNEAIYALTWEQDRETLITGGMEPVIRVWDIANQALLKSLDLPGGTVLALEVSPDGSTLASINFDAVQTLSLWNLTDYSLLASTASGDSMGLKWKPQGDLLALAHMGSGIFLINPSALAENQKIGGEIPASSISWSPDGRYLVSGEFDLFEPSEVYLWDASNGEQLAVLGSHPTETETRVAWSPDGQLIASAASDDTVYIYDSQTYQVIDYFDKAETYIHDLAFSPYGGQLAYGGQKLDNAIPQFSNGAIRVIVPAPSLVRLGYIAPLCFTKKVTLLSADAMAALTIEQLPDFISQIEALPTDTIPAACQADLIAVAKTIIGQE